MSSVQITACQPTFNVVNIYHSRYVQSMPCVALAHPFQLQRNSLKLPKGSSHYKFTKFTKVSPRLTPVCIFGGKGKSENGKEASPWKSLENAMGSLKKEQSLEDVLRQQMEKQEYFDDGGSGGKSPGGGGGGGGGGDGLGGSEGEGDSGILDETLQVILATAGFIFLYMYIIEGEEIAVLAKDYLKFLFRGQKSIRLRRTMYQWGMFYQRLTTKKEVQPDWLERAIINTPTWWDSPEKYKLILRSYISSRSYDDDE